MSCLSIDQWISGCAICSCESARFRLRFTFKTFELLQDLRTLAKFRRSCFPRFPRFPRSPRDFRTLPQVRSALWGVILSILRHPISPSFENCRINRDEAEKVRSSCKTSKILQTFEDFAILRRSCKSSKRMQKFEDLPKVRRSCNSSKRLQKFEDLPAIRRPCKSSRK